MRHERIREKEVEIVKLLKAAPPHLDAEKEKYRSR
jgi:hypothetical protein